MATVTYYVALPFLRAEDGSLTPGEAMECQSTGQAFSRAAGMALKSGGAVAFSRTGDPALGDFDPAVVLATYRDAPDGCRSCEPRS